MSEYDDGQQLAAQLGNRLQHTLHGRRRACKSAIQGLLRLGQFLLRLHCFCVRASLPTRSLAATNMHVATS